MPIDPKVIALATVKFLDNGDVVVTLNTSNGVTARKLEVAATKLYNKLSEVRATERRKQETEARKLSAATTVESQPKP